MLKLNKNGDLVRPAYPGAHDQRDRKEVVFITAAELKAAGLVPTSWAEQCNNWVQQIYYANIATNHKAIADVVSEIAYYYYKQNAGEQR